MGCAMNVVERICNGLEYWKVGASELQDLERRFVVGVGMSGALLRVTKRQ